MGTQHTDGLHNIMSVQIASDTPVFFEEDAVALGLFVLGIRQVRAGVGEHDTQGAGPQHERGLLLAHYGAEDQASLIYADGLSFLRLSLDVCSSVLICHFCPPIF